jgi:hypothetical protein
MRVWLWWRGLKRRALLISVSMGGTATVARDWLDLWTNPVALI